MPVHAHTASPAATDPSLEGDSRLVLSHVQSELQELIRALPGGSEIRRPAHLQQVLGVDSALGWQIYRAAHSPSPLAVGVHLPGPVAMGRIFESALRLHVSESVVAAAKGAYGQFEALIHRHADDQRAFQALLESILQESSDGSGANGGSQEGVPARLSLKERRAAFRSNSHLWGIQARTRIVCTIVCPQRGGTKKYASIDGMVDLVSFRRNVEVRIGHRRVYPDSDDPAGEGEVGSGPELIDDFCTQPFPALRKRRVRGEGAAAAAGSQVDLLLGPQTLGKRGALTYFCRQIAQGAAAEEDERETKFSFQCFVAVPTEVQLVDALLPRGWVDPSTAHASFFACSHDPRASFLRHEDDRLLPYASGAHLGRGLDQLNTRGFPRYRELVSRVLGDMGLDAEELDLYRVRVEYPILHSATMLNVVAPDSEVG